MQNHKDNTDNPGAAPQVTENVQESGGQPAGGRSGKSPRPNCMRPCPAVLEHGPRKPNDRSRTQFGRPKTGIPGRKPPEPEPPKHPDGRAIRQPFDGKARLYEVIQVRLVRTQRLVEVSTGNLRLSPNTQVLVRIHRNVLLATTVGYRYRKIAEIDALPFVVRIASDEDLKIDQENAIIEKRAQVLATGFALENNLQMKVLSADLSHDHKNITVNFASDVRVDFRTMVAFLAGQLKLRVEMYQLGLRNGTGLICGLGSCGQLLCCGRFLGQFDPVAVRQLRAQGLAANPKRISGVCGRLYCCMSYEYVDYMKEQRTLPKKGRRVFTRWGIGRVTDIDMIREDIVVSYDNGDTQRITPRDFLPVTDEILAKVEKGEIEFPLEPGRYYLNHDPSAACEMETKTQARSSHTNHVPHSRTHKIEAASVSPKRGVIAQRHEKASKEAAPVVRKKSVSAVSPVKNRPQNPASAAEASSKKRENPSVQNPASAAEAASKKRESTPARHPASPSPQDLQAIQAARHSMRHTHTPPPQMMDVPPLDPLTSKPVTTSVAPAQTHPQMTRVPRKVQARKANLEESAVEKENRNRPTRTSRRRFNPHQGS